jgi:hypothetical protein
MRVKGEAAAMLRKYGLKVNGGMNKVAEVVAMKAAEKFRKKILAEHTPGVDPLGAGAQARAVANDRAAQERLTADLNKAKPQIGSRAAMMAEAKERKIKYFRIMTKDELIIVLNPRTPAHDIGDITATAIARWKKGWKSNHEVKEVGASV